MSKQLERALDVCVLESEFSVSSLYILGDINTYRTAVVPVIKWQCEFTE